MLQILRNEVKKTYINIYEMSKKVKNETNNDLTYIYLFYLFILKDSIYINFIFVILFHI